MIMTESVAVVLSRRDRLFDAVSSAAGPGVLGGDGVTRAAEAAAAELPKGCQYGAVYRTMSSAVAEDAASPRVRLLCWAMAADVESLRLGEPVRYGYLPPDPVEVVVQVIASDRVVYARDSGNSGGGFPVKYRVKSLVGVGSPYEFDLVWSSKYVSFFATRQDGLGFAGRATTHRPPTGKPYRHYSTLVGMRMVLTAAASDRGVKVTGSRCPQGLREYNSALTAMRWRDGFDCPFEYDHHCQACPKGQTSCPAACRPMDLVAGPCPGCGKEFDKDPFWGATCCPSCNKSGRHKKG